MNEKWNYTHIIVCLGSFALGYNLSMLEHLLEQLFLRNTSDNCFWYDKSFLVLSKNKIIEQKHKVEK